MLGRVVPWGFWHGEGVSGMSRFWGLGVQGHDEKPSNKSRNPPGISVFFGLATGDPSFKAVVCNQLSEQFCNLMLSTVICGGENNKRLIGLKSLSRMTH